MKETRRLKKTIPSSRAKWLRSAWPTTREPWATSTSPLRTGSTRRGISEGRCWPSASRGTTIRAPDSTITRNPVGRAAPRPRCVTGRRPRAPGSAAAAGGDVAGDQGAVLGGDVAGAVAGAVVDDEDLGADAAGLGRH